MRRSIVAAALAAALALSAQVAGPTQATGTGTGAVTDAGPLSDPHARQVLATAQAALDHPASAAARRTASPARPEVSLALRDLFVARDRLLGGDREQADRLLARPTDGLGDGLGDGYTVPARRVCDTHVCVHWVPTTADAPPSRDWVDATLAEMGAVWHTEVDHLGYREPITDGGRGGNAKFDVYLKELGSQGIYGYCAPENRTPDHRWLADGYCVLDNDFAQRQYGAPPRDSLRVTAAHEFFHAVQFAYDYGEDGWLMESTATWMEERVADDVNDNRQYLPAGQVGVPRRSLDVYDQQGFNQYGNWPFFEYLGLRFGHRIVKAVWTAAGAYPGSGHRYSTTAVRRVLEKHGGFVDVFGTYAAANTVPGRTYPEGHRWPRPTPAEAWQVTRAHPKVRTTIGVNHMAARTVRFLPAPSLAGPDWRLRVVVTGPPARTDPAAYLVVQRVHRLVIRPLPLDDVGRGHVDVHFTASKVRWAAVVLVNASTRFSCWRRTSYSCQGKARDDHLPFTVRAVAHR